MNKSFLSSRRGNALIVVLAFIVLLSVVVVGFLARALFARTLTHSSSGQNKADFAAQGAINQIISDLQQEIVDGSTATQVSSSPQVTIYMPKKGANMVPSINAYSPSQQNSGATTGLENLLKVSQHGTPFYQPGYLGSSYNGAGANRASTSSTKNSSLNGRSLTNSFWTAPYLTGSNGTIPAPDWVLMARDGTNPNSWSKNYAVTGSNPVTERYAYTLYNEGGTLDLNLAGYPSSGGVPAREAYKNSLAYADLTQLDPQGITQEMVNQIVGWRNRATTQANGTFPNYSFSDAALTLFDQYISGNSNGFMQVNSTSNPVQSDQAFTSRQQMLQFLKSLNMPTKDFQYFGTFSRDINQPSYAPNPNRPHTQIYSGSGDPSQVGSYGTNDAGRNDDITNPSFLATRVQHTFTRNDGSTALPGEPLVKKRFDLNRLAWLTYVGPITLDGTTMNPQLSPSYVTALINQYNITLDFLKQGTPENIYKSFGLSWVTDSRRVTNGNASYFVGDQQSKWYYNHQTTTGPYTTFQAVGTKIKVLSSLSTLLRDPDYFELLLSSITCGSKGRQCTSMDQFNKQPIIPALSLDAYLCQQDSSLDKQIVQIGANIIDQFDIDGFPTRILYSNGNLTREIRGSENLPYFYRYRIARVKAINPTVSLAAPFAATFAPPAPNKNVMAGTITSLGAIVQLLEPEIWDPYDQSYPRCALSSIGNTPLPDNSGAPLFPTTFRIVAESTSPDQIYNTDTNGLPKNASDLITTLSQANYNLVDPKHPGGSTYEADAVDLYYSGISQQNAIDTTPPSLFATTVLGSPFAKASDLTGLFNFPYTAENTALTFNMGARSPTLFREPTLLVNPDIPVGSNLAASGKFNILNIKNFPPAGTVPLSSVANQGSPSPQALLIKTSGSADFGIQDAAQDRAFLGIYVTTLPAVFYSNLNYNAYYSGAKITPPLPPPPTLPLTINIPSRWVPDPMTDQNNNVTFRMQYQTNSGLWVSYDDKYAAVKGWSEVDYTTEAQPPYSQIALQQTNDMGFCVACDPRSDRWGMPGYNSASGDDTKIMDTVLPPNGPPSSTFKGWVNSSLNMISSMRPDSSLGLTNYFMTRITQAPSAQGWNPSYSKPTTFGAATLKAGSFAIGAYSQNDDSQHMYLDLDGVQRKGMGAYYSSSTQGLFGLPLATATNGTTIVNSGSRPIVLNRPFISVADLGYVFSDTPWKNLDFFTPESGDDPLLDVFCVGEANNASNLFRGKIDLNTRQAPVIRALVAGSLKDEPDALPTNQTLPSQANITNEEATTIGNALIARTTSPLSGKGPLANIAETVGKYVSGSPGSAVYDGFSADLTSDINGNPVFRSDITANNIQRFRESVVRAFSNSGQCRVWNLMIDVVAQSGRYPAAATSTDDFNVEGEKHYWVHVAIDRFTGAVLDKSVELVKQ